MADPALLVANKLSRFYHGRQVLHGIDLELRRGDVLGFLGPNGAGKSTTMNILCGVLAPHGGSVRICGFDLATQPLEAKRHLGYLPESPPVHLDATVDEYLGFCARLRQLKSADAHTAVGLAKKNCELDDVGSRLIGNLSKGFRQRVGIAQALLHQPDVVVLDEPTSGLDPNQIRAVRATIHALARHHTVILSTHVLSEAQALCNRVAILHHGRIAFDQAIEHGNDILRVRFASEAAIPDWTEVDGLLDVATQNDGHFYLKVESYERAADDVCRMANDLEIGLRELSRDTSPLEQTFVELTCNDEASSA